MISIEMGRFSVISLLVAGLWSAPALASRNEDLQKRIADLEARVEQQQTELDELAIPRSDERDVYAEPAIGSERSDYNPSRSWRKAYGASEAKVQVHGFINLEFVKAQRDGAHGGRPNFDLHHANTFVDALLRHDFRTHIEMEFEHAIEEIEIDQAYMAWSPCRYMTLTAGRFYAPFGIERFTWYPPVNHLVSRPLAFKQIVPGNFYQHGLMLSGEARASDLLRFSYEFSLSNGLGQSAASSRRSSRLYENDNAHLATTGRLATVFWPWLEIGASFHSQRFDDAGPEQNLLFLGLDTSARWKGFELRGEYVYASADRVSAPGLYQSGWYAQLGYTLEVERRFLDSIVFAVRVDEADLDRSASTGVLRYTLGSALQIYSHFRVKAEYRFETEEGPSKQNDAFMTAFVADF